MFLLVHLLFELFFNFFNFLFSLSCAPWWSWFRLVADSFHIEWFLLILAEVSLYGCLKLLIIGDFSELFDNFTDSFFKGQIADGLSNEKFNKIVNHCILCFTDIGPELPRREKDS